MCALLWPLHPHSCGIAKKILKWFTIATQLRLHVAADTNTTTILRPASCDAVHNLKPWKNCKCRQQYKRQIDNIKTNVDDYIIKKKCN
jgi:hypothetical protein